MTATLGSCFAQHIGRELKKRGYRWLEAEPPVAEFPQPYNEKFQYGMFSFRTGNIYTPRVLRQWLDWAVDGNPSAEFWYKGTQVIDPFRPTVQPDGFADGEECSNARKRTLRAIRDNVPKIDVLVFTLGQTEGWRNKASGWTYAICPGTHGGRFDADRHEFVNFGVSECLADMKQAVRQLRVLNPKIKLLLTVSPVPMVATASAQHVLLANARTKSVLRATAAALTEEADDIDYFPSYELITQPPFRAIFYEPNMRSVSRAGVDFVMDTFFSIYQGDGAAKSTLRAHAPPATMETRDAEAVFCDEIMLDAGIGG